MTYEEDLNRRKDEVSLKKAEIDKLLDVISTLRNDIRYEEEAIKNIEYALNNKKISRLYL